MKDATYKADRFVTSTKFPGHYGKVLYQHGDLLVCDWYTESRGNRGMVFQQGADVSTCTDLKEAPKVHVK